MFVDSVSRYFVLLLILGMLLSAHPQCKWSAIGSRALVLEPNWFIIIMFKNEDDLKILWHDVAFAPI